jgi:uncharacterized membrane protein YfcA
MDYLGYFALIGIGLILSLTGAGGSLLSLPILVYLFSLDVVTASSYSLFIVGTTSLIGAWLEHKRHRVDFRTGIVFGIFSVISIFVTRTWIVPRIPDEILLSDSLTVTKRVLMLGIFALLAISSSAIILLKHTWTTSHTAESRLKFLIPTGIVTGIVVGLAGVGGGFLILPSLLLFARLPFKPAVGTTLLIIGFNSMLGFLGDVINYPINWLFLLLITCFSIVGMLLGHLYSARMPRHYIRLAFGWIVLTVAVAMLAREFVL